MSNQLKLLETVQVGSYTLKNRLVMAPLTRNRAGAGNVPGTINAEYYRQRTSAGLIVTEATQISPQGVGYPKTPGIHSPEQVEGWKLVTKEVHENNGCIFLQLWHVGRISHPSLQPNGELPVAPSAIAPEGMTITDTGKPQPFVTPRALETDEIPQIVEQYRQAAKNAMVAGFDGVEIHGANGYLLDLFFLAFLVSNGWEIYFHPQLFGTQYQEICDHVSKLREKLPLEEFKTHATVKLFAGITVAIETKIPSC